MRLALSIVMLGSTLAIAAPADRDRDGIVDSVDRCPSEPEDRDGFQDDDGCPDPDNDGDGIVDAGDSCPMDPEDRDGFQDDDGCPDPDNDADGILDAADKCPLAPEDRDGFQDLDGCPELDNDRDGIDDTRDSCPMEAETINGNQDDDGCPDRGDPLVMVAPDRMDLLAPIEFDKKAPAKLAKESFNVLGQVAAHLRAQPAILRMRVTCHVHPTSNAQRDQELSEKRANAVREWIVQWGIAASRVEARGFGGTRPLKRPDDKMAAQVNNRIEFVILERK